MWATNNNFPNVQEPWRTMDSRHDVRARHKVCIGEEFIRRAPHIEVQLQTMFDQEQDMFGRVTGLANFEVEVPSRTAPSHGHRWPTAQSNMETLLPGFLSDMQPRPRVPVRIGAHTNPTVPWTTQTTTWPLLGGATTWDPGIWGPWEWGPWDDFDPRVQQGRTMGDDD